jgi:hypothetical protein
MPRGRKPKTATPVLTPVEQELMGVYSVKHDETVALYKDLAKIKDLLNTALRHVGFIDECESIGEAAFKAGRAYGPLDEANDKVESMLESLYENGDFNFDHWEDLND